MKYSAPYTPPTLTVDAVIFQIKNDALEVLLINRSQDPFKNILALPGGYCAAGQTTEQAFDAVLKRKTGITKKDLSYVEQLYTFDTVARDPRGHAVSVSYMGCGRNIETSGGTDEARFFPVDNLPTLAYDHKDIIAYARERLLAKLTYTNAVSALLPNKFTLTMLQTAYEAVFGRRLDKRNFRKKFLSLNLIKETEEYWREGAHRPAKLFIFNSRDHQTLSRDFE